MSEDWRDYAQKASAIRTELLCLTGQGTLPFSCLTDEENAAIKAAVERALNEASSLSSKAMKLKGRA